LAGLRATMATFGLKLMLDFVPNHSAKDAVWLSSHPEIYLHQPNDSASNPEWWESFHGVSLAHGRSPWDLWKDTLQLNYWSPDTVRVMTDLLVGIAEHADAIRTDMAMLLLNDVWERSWGTQMRALGFQRPPEEFWWGAIREVRRRFPKTIFVAEAYDYGISKVPEKQLLVSLGFDFIYDKDVLDNMERGLDNIRGYVAGRGEQYLSHATHFVENHDEPRAAHALGGEQQAFVGAVLAATLPGMRLFYDGQFDGFKNRLVVQLRRAASEPRNPELHHQYTKFLGVLADPVFRRGMWTNIDVSKEGSGWRLLAWRWSLGDTKRLVVVNFSDEWGSAPVLVADALGHDGNQIRLKDLLTGIYYDRDANEMRSSGLTCILGPFSVQIFRY